MKFMSRQMDKLRETVVNFKELAAKGVPASEVSSAINHLLK